MRRVQLHATARLGPSPRAVRLLLDAVLSGERVCVETPSREIADRVADMLTRSGFGLDLVRGGSRLEIGPASVLH